MWHLAKISNLDLGTPIAPKWFEHFSQLNITSNKPHPCQRKAKKKKRTKSRKSQNPHTCVYAIFANLYPRPFLSSPLVALCY